MTSIGLLVLVAGVGLIWAGVTNVGPVEAFKAALSGKPAPAAAAPVAAKPATTG